MAWHFLDVEASALAGYPIEVGWVSLRDDMVFEAGGSVLIKPDPEWIAVGYWDWNAEQMHGLTLDRLQAEGLDVMDVARRLNSDLRGLTLLSDNLAFDARWLSDLHDAGGVLGGYLVDELSRGFARARALHPGASDGAAKLAMEMVAEAGLVAHRALDDALRGALLIAALAVLAGQVDREAMVARVRQAKAKWGRQG